MSAADDIIEYLQAQGEGTIGGSSQWSLHVSREPDKPGATVTIYDTGGSPPDPDNDVYNPRIQVRVRHKDYRTAIAKLKAIRDLLIDPVGGITANGTRYFALFALSDPESIGYDDKDRARVVLNFDISYEA